MTRLRAGAATDVGLVRSVNQDHLLVDAAVFAVADGMGGHAAGEVASLTAVHAFQAALSGPPSDVGALAEAVRSANRAVWDEAQANPDFRGMGTTLTALALIDGDADLVAIANVGDSRTYRLRADRLEQLTVDHSLVAELVADGQICADEAETHPQRHVLTRALGVYPDVEVDLLTSDPEPGDRYLLCSDGLSREVSDQAISSVLRRLADPADAARELVAEAKLRGGNDNITVVVVDVLDDDEPAHAPADGQGAMITGGGPYSAAGAGGYEGSDLTAAVATVVTAAPGDEPSDHRSGADAPAEADDGPPPALTRAERRELRRNREHVERPRNRLVTSRVVAFVVLLLAVVGAGAAGTAWYARAGYFVGVRNGHLTIFQGHPGGVLWWNPTVEQVTGVTTAAVEPYHLAALRSGVEESSLAAARRYVENLRAEARSAGIDPSAGSGG